MHPEFFSTSDNGQNRVSNNLLSLVVRVTDVDSLSSDDAVQIEVFRAYPTFGTDCALVLPGREYAIDRESTVDGGMNPGTRSAWSSEGRIVAGRFQVVPSGNGAIFEFPIAQANSVLPLRFPLHDLQLRAEFALGGLPSGSLGGWSAGADLALPMACYSPDYLDVMRSMIGGITDIAIMDNCGSPTTTPPTYGGVGLGLGFHAVPAVLADRAVGGRWNARGSC